MGTSSAACSRRGHLPLHEHKDIHPFDELLPVGSELRGGRLLLLHNKDVNSLARKLHLQSLRGILNPLHIERTSLWRTIEESIFLC